MLGDTTTPALRSDHVASGTDTSWAGGFPSDGEHLDAIPATEEECLLWYRPLLASMVRKYAQHNHPVLHPEDVFQEACIGLLNAYRKFDPTRGVFAAFAQQCVFSSVMDLLRRADPLSPHSRQKLRALPDWFAATAQARQPTSDEFERACHDTTLTSDMVRGLLSADRLCTLHINIPANHDMWDSLIDPREQVQTPEIGVDLRDAAQRCMEQWHPRDKYIFVEAVVMGRKQSDLAQEMGLTQARISQIATRCWTDIFTAIGSVARP